MKVARIGRVRDVSPGKTDNAYAFVRRFCFRSRDFGTAVRFRVLVRGGWSEGEEESEALCVALMVNELASWCC